MQEPQVSQIVQQYFSKQGYKIHREIAVGGTDREVIIDYWLFKEPNENIWVECKGDQGISDLLEGFIRLEFAVFYGGGKGILAIPNEAYQKLTKYAEFLKQAENVICLLNVEEISLNTSTQEVTDYNNLLQAFID